MLVDGYVSERKHPEHELYIYDYSMHAQIDKVWNDVTMQCRGLILDKSKNVIARPFPKFFNFDEHKPEDIPQLPFEVYTKLDGSLGILYWINDEPFISTRGSFVSSQAIKATEMLKTHYANCIPHLQKGRTYLWEIIYPQNRIVIDYAGQEQLVLLAVIDNATGRDLPLEDIGFPIVQRHDGLDYHNLKELEWKNHEGFVVKFSNGFRIKIKFDEYVRLHRIVTGISNKSIWDALRHGQDIDEILQQVPDELYAWARLTKEDFLRQYQEIEKTCRNDFKTFDTRKEAALYFQKCKYPHILFAMLDNMDYSDTIWKLLRPTFERPFRTVGEIE